MASTTATAGSNQCRWLASPIGKDTASYFTMDGMYDVNSAIGVIISVPGEDREDVNKGCMLQSTEILSTKLGGGTTRMSGTSVAAPHVAGVAALLWQYARPTALDPNPLSTLRFKLRTSTSSAGGANQFGTAPKDSPTNGYSFDGEREGVVWAPGVVSQTRELSCGRARARMVHASPFAGAPFVRGAANYVSLVCGEFNWVIH